MRGPASELPAIAAEIRERLRTRGPRVHCITNAVAQVITANTLLAAGVVPSMTIASDEIGAFVQRADALLINLGTFDAERRKASDVAIDAAKKSGKPWVLDPVFIDRSPARAAYAKELLARGPNIVRLNQAEFKALAGFEPRVDKLTAFAREHGTVIGLTGAADLVADGARLATINNGDPLMTKVTALGCAESALVAACLAVEPDAWRACAAALLIMGLAGEIAAQRARGPGTFAAEILDALFALDRNALLADAKVS